MAVTVRNYYVVYAEFEVEGDLSGEEAIKKVHAFESIEGVAGVKRTVGYCSDKGIEFETIPADLQWEKFVAMDGDGNTLAEEHILDGRG